LLVCDLSGEPVTLDCDVETVEPERQQIEPARLAQVIARLPMGSEEADNE